MGAEQAGRPRRRGGPDEARPAGGRIAPGSLDAGVLLGDLTGRQRAERAVIVGELAGQGVRAEEIQRAIEQGTLVYLPAERFITGAQRFTAAEVAERSGTDVRFRSRRGGRWA